MRAGGFAAGSALIGAVRYHGKRRTTASILPVHAGTDRCPTCMAAPGETHMLSCRAVSYEQFEAWRVAEREEYARQVRRDRRAAVAARVLLGVAVLAAAALVCWLSLAPLAGGTR